MYNPLPDRENECRSLSNFKALTREDHSYRVTQQTQRIRSLESFLNPCGLAGSILKLPVLSEGRFLTRVRNWQKRKDNNSQ